MRILKVLGRNIRSLYGDFVLDLTQPVFRESGLFAIVGPTGSGKSTVLDTICLALYGVCPRLGGSGSKISADELSGSDARTAVSKGAIDSLAEVTLESGGRIYRARWTVHRAHRRVHGKLQPSRHELVDVGDDRVIASGARNTEEAITSVTGLDYQQFRRSVLLAQGEFAEFMNAPEDERARLLETITGRQVYSLLSIRAHEKGRDIENRSEQLRARLSEIHRPTDQEISGVAEKITSVEVTIKNLEDRITYHRQQMEWYGTFAKLKEVAVQAGNMLEDVRKEYDQNATERKLLEKARRAWDFRAEMAAYQAAVKDHEMTRRVLVSLKKKQVTAEEKHRRSRLDLESADRESKLENDRFARIKPEIDDARKLDVQLGEKMGYLEKLQENRGQSQNELQGVLGECDETTQETRRITDKLKNEEQWLEAHSGIQPVADNRALWKEKLHRLITQENRRNLLTENLASMEKTHKEQTKVTKALIRKQRSYTGKLKSLRETLKSLEKNASGLRKSFDPEKSQDQMVSTVESMSMIQQIVKAREEREDVVAEIRQMESRKAQCESARNDLTQRLETLKSEQTEREIRLDESRRLLERIRAVFDHEAVRERLVSGQPCPVCGSKDHPYMQDGVPERAVKLEEEKRVESLEENQRAASRKLQSTEGELAAIMERIQNLDTGLKIQHAKIEELDSGLENTGRFLLRTLSTLDMPEEGSTVDPLGDPISTLRSMEDRLAGIRTTISGWQEQAGALDRELGKIRDEQSCLQGEENKVGRELNELHVKQSAAETDIRRTKEAIKTAGEEIESMYTQMDGEMREISTVWETECRLSPTEFLAHLEAKADDYVAHGRELDNYRNRILECDPQLAALKAKKVEAQKRVKQLERSEKSLQVQLGEIRDKRAAMLEGQTVAEVEVFHAERLSELDTRLKLTRGEEKEAGLELKQVQTEREKCRREVTEGAAVVARTLRDYRTVLATHDLEQAEAEALVQRGKSFFSDLETKVKMLESRLRKAEAAQQERQKDFEAFESDSQRPQQPAEQIREQQTRFTKENDELKKKREDLRFTRREYQKNIKQYASVQEMLDREHASGDVWRTLKELIGSHDGSRFRKFAQRLTLDQLVILANRQLARLAPRYRLFVPHEERLELAVEDRDRADERRPVTTLSGGETFLVSLALALSLASLSSRRANIQTLFIDEGFGSLDAHTLDIALATLEMLQSHGKLIGVISHVPALQERISCQVRVVPQGGGRSRLELAVPGLPH